MRKQSCPRVSTNRSEMDSDVPIPLLVSLTYPIEGRDPEALLLGAIRNSLGIWFPNTDKANIVKAVMLKNSRQAVVFLGDQEFVQFLTSSDREFSLLGPVSGKFLSASAITTDCFVISINQHNRSTVFNGIDSICKETSCSYTAVLQRFDEILIAMSSKVPQGIRAFNSKLQNLDAICTFKAVTVGDHRCLTMYWIGNISVDEVITRLDRSGHSFTSLLRGLLSLWDHQVCIVSVQVQAEDRDHSLISPSKTQRVVLVCCTEMDMTIIKDARQLFISKDIYLSITPEEGGSTRAIESSETTLLKTAGSPERISLSSFGSPSVASTQQPTISPAKGLTSTAQHKSSAKHVDCLFIWDLDSCPIDPIDEVYTIYDCIENKISDLFAAKVSQSSKKYLFSTSQENTTMIKATSRQILDFQTLNFKIIKNSRKHLSIVAIADEIEAAVAIHSKSFEKPAVILLTGDVDASSILASLRLEGFKRVLLAHSAGYKSSISGLATEAMPWLSLKSYTTLGFPPPRPVQSSTISNLEEPLQKECKYNEKILLHQYSVALHIKHLEEWEVIREYIGTEVFLTFNIGIKKKSQVIVVGSDTNSLVLKALDRLRTITDGISSTCRISTLKRWHPQHREAILKSEPLLEAEKNLEVTGLFYKSEANVISVEVVSIDSTRVRKFYEFLDTLLPAEEPLYTPKDFKLTDLDISTIRKAYAIKIDYGDSFKWKSPPPLKIWGFKYRGLLAKAITALEETTRLSSHPIMSEIESEQAPALLDDLQKVQIQSTGPSQQMRTVFKFKTREAGVLYQTYEDLCSSFIERISDIEVEKLDQTQQKAGVNSVMQTTITLIGEGDGMLIAKDYLKRFQTSLSHTQVFFPNISGEKYQQLHEFKTIFEELLGGIYDPLLTWHLLSVRVKPLMNSRGIKRMIWPCDVWVTICGPSEEYVAETERLLVSLKSDFITHTVSVPKSSPLRDRLEEYSSRNEFIKEFNILGARLSLYHSNAPDLLTMWISSHLAREPDFLSLLNSRSETIPILRNLDLIDEKDNSFANSLEPFYSNASETDFFSSVQSIRASGDHKSRSSSAEYGTEDEDFDPFSAYTSLSRILAFDQDLICFEDNQFQAAISANDHTSPISAEILEDTKYLTPSRTELAPNEKDSLEYWDPSKFEADDTEFINGG